MLAVTRAAELVSCCATDVFLAFSRKLFCYHIKLFTQLAEGILAAVSLEESSIQEMTAKFVGGFFLYFLPFLKDLYIVWPFSACVCFVL